MKRHAALNNLPLGASYLAAEQGTFFAVYSTADEVQLCLYDSIEAGAPTRTLPLLGDTRAVFPESQGSVRYGFVEGVASGQLYGFRAHGVYEPRQGFRHNGRKVLLDPYTPAVGRKCRADDSFYGYVKSSGDDLIADMTDSQAFAPLSVVRALNTPEEPTFDWGNDAPPNVPWEDTVIREVHVKGETMRHPRIRPEYRGTYTGLAQMCAYYQRLGCTAVELMPAHESIQLLRDYWRYNSMAYFAPEREYAAFRRPLDICIEFKKMVKRFHQHGIEVILDVVYNHTAEGNHLGPTLSLRGLANTDYYLLCGNPEVGEYRYYMNGSGCGNTLNLSNPVTLQLVVDSLRYWVNEYHIDGFRFDLASILAKTNGEFRPDHPFLLALEADPVLRGVKKIAEPWDCSATHVAGFPKPWREWNDFYRDTVRRYWLNTPSLKADFATAIAGSRLNLYPVSTRGEAASINFITSHDGFTLRDLVSYEVKHNAENGEGNQDGSAQNFSSNHGCEGETTDLSINRRRLKKRRSLLATLAFSYGVPMLLGGDELGRTQNGNNNAYCHDSPLTWLDWRDRDKEFVRFTKKVFALRRKYSALRSIKRSCCSDSRSHVRWFASDGVELTDGGWQTSGSNALSVLLLSEAPGRKSYHRPLLLVFNPSEEDVNFTLPALGATSLSWRTLVITSNSDDPFESRKVQAQLLTQSESLALMVASSTFSF